MWFRSLLIYRITQAIDLAAEALEVALGSKPARPCESQELTTYGFATPLGKGDNAPLVHAVEGMLLISTRKQERILPGSVVRDALKEKVDEIEETQMRKVYKKERDQLKDEIVQAFLPRAFIRKSSTFAAIDPVAGLIYVDASSPKRAEDLLSTLREAIGSLPVRPVTVKIAPTATLTDWLKQQKAAEGFFVLDQALLRDTHAEGGSIAAKHQDLTSEEIQLHLSAGKQATQLALAWQEKLSFVIDDKLQIKRLRFEDLLTDQAAQDGGDDALSQQSASFFLMMRTFREFVPELLTALGGEETPQGLGEEQGPGFESRLEARAATNKPARQVDIEELIAQGQAGDVIDGTANDPLYVAAVEFVRESRRASISAVQRKLLIGYNRAARLIEAMEVAGIVSAMNSNGSREVIRHG
ncbi:DNA recombination-dependent growth factor C [Ectopseudomonas oleovorans]|uniref:Recombination-associated protein RdgC n=1 Tax=Ectopseudomonas oleovorans TaxID=301 RepID=A0A653B0G8_ECTOL|nr:DNA recombination-dependent growth factor C [Pseudomonas oleovorans]